jgi:hypothetical protein
MRKTETSAPRRWRRIASWAASLAVGFYVLLTAAPELLAWPHVAQHGRTRIYSNAPVPPEIDRVLARTDALLSRSPIDRPDLERRLFLTDGGWRWSLLAPGHGGAFALRRPWRDAVIVNRSDIAGDRVENGAAIGGRRTLSGILAHELTHVLIGHRYGELRAAFFASWLVEGYADHVAQESSLSDADYRRLRADGSDHPALDYYEGRRQVALLLARSGGNPDALFGGD